VEEVEYTRIKISYCAVTVKGVGTGCRCGGCRCQGDGLQCKITI